MFKNVASQGVALFAMDITTGAPKTGDAANITPYVSKDLGTVTALGTATATEMSSTNAPGWYSFVLTQAETNGDQLLFTAKSSTANIKLVGRPIDTLPANFTTLVIDGSGRGDISKIGGTLQTAGDIYSKVSALTYTIANQVDVNVKDWAGAAVASAAAGIPKVDIDTIKTNPVVNAGTITFPTGATLASTVNITAGTITTTTNLSNLPAIPANWLTAAGIAAGALNGKGDWLLSSGYTAPSNLTAAQIATGIFQDTTAGDFTVALSVGKSIMNGVTLGTGLTVAAVSGAVGSVTGAVGSVTGLTASDVGAIKTQTDKLAFTSANKVDANVLALNGDATAAANIAKTTRAICRGTVGAASTTTSIVTSAFVPTGVDTDQFKGAIITFDADTTTVNLRGERTDITGSTNAATPVLSCTALSTAPVSGDTFSVT